MGPTEDPDAVAREVAALADRFASLGRRLADVARELTEGGAPPSVEVIDELDASRSQLADARRRVVDVARAMEVPAIPAPEELASVQALRSLLEAAIQAGEQRAARDAKQRALAVLERIDDLRHRDDPRFAALVACQAAAAQLHAVLAAVEWPASHGDLTALAEGRHPLAYLLEFVERQDTLDDARWEQLEDALVAAFGRPLAVAAARGRLTVGVAVPRPTPAPLAEPALHGDWGDEWPTVTIERPAEPAPTSAAPRLAGGEEHVACLQALLWDALGQDRVGIAFHLATHLEEEHPDPDADRTPRLPPWLLRAVALGRHVRHANGDVALLLGEDFARVAAGDAPINAGDGDEGRAARLVLAAAALRPALVAPDTAAWSVLRLLRQEDGAPYLTRYCQLVADYGQGHPPLGQDLPALDPAAWRDTLEDLLREIGAWRVRVLGLRTPFPPATAVWRQWLRPDGLIHSLLLPLTVDPWGLDMARGLVERLSNEAQIRWEVAETDRRVLGRRVGPDIEARPAALRELRRRVREAVGFAHRWIALQESRPGRAEDEARRQTRRLSESLHELRASVADEVAALCSPSASPPLRAAGTQCRVALESVDRLLAEGFGRQEEPLPARILHADLLRVPGALLDADWQPRQKDDEAVTEGLQEVLASREEARDWRRAFDGAVAALDHRASGQIIDYLDLDPDRDGAVDKTSEGNGELNLDELRSIRAQALQRCREALAHAVAATRGAIDSAAAHGLLTESERGRFSDRTERVALALPATLRFAPPHQALRDVREELGEPPRLAQAAIAAGREDGDEVDGRGRERAELEAMDGPCLLFGGPHMGASTLLRQIARDRHAPARGDVAVCVDLAPGAAGELQPPAERLWRVTQRELALAGVIAPENAAAGSPHPDAIVHGIDRWLRADPARRLLLLIDEADGLLEGEAGTTSDSSDSDSDSLPTGARCAELMARHRGRCKVVVAGRQVVQRVAKHAQHPLARAGSLRLGPLLDDGGWRAARALAQRLVADAGCRFETTDLLDRVLARANYRPGGIRRYCELLVSRASDGRITSEQVDAVASSREGRDILAAPLLAAALDPRYDVIARSLALDYWDAPEEAEVSGDGVPRASLSAEAAAWWGPGFRHDPPNDWAELFDEMVGLAVLRPAGADSVALDCPNLVPYLGSEDEQVACLLELGTGVAPAASQGER